MGSGADLNLDRVGYGRNGIVVKLRRPTVTPFSIGALHPGNRRQILVEMGVHDSILLG
jgi:hypothetical protein